jgi:Tol biopolymer transport system component
VFSPDGTKVAFGSLANNLGPADADRPGPALDDMDLYVRNLAGGGTTLASANGDGTNSANAPTSSGVFSPDSSKIAFATFANDLGPTDSDRPGPTDSDVYLKTLSTGAIALVSVNAAGTDSGNQASDGATFSPDGTKIAFSSGADNLGPTDSTRPGGASGLPGSSDVYLRNLSTGTTELVSHDSAGTDSGNDLSAGGVFSSNGGRIAFVSWASNLGPQDTNDCSEEHHCGDVYVRDLTTGALTLVSARADGKDSGNNSSSGPLFGVTGAVAFLSSATDLGPADANGQPDLYLATIPGG